MRAACSPRFARPARSSASRSARRSRSWRSISAISPGAPAGASSRDARSPERAAGVGAGAEGGRARRGPQLPDLAASRLELVARARQLGGELLDVGMREAWLARGGCRASAVARSGRSGRAGGLGLRRPARAPRAARAPTGRRGTRSGRRPGAARPRGHRVARAPRPASPRPRRCAPRPARHELGGGEARLGVSQLGAQPLRRLNRKSLCGLHALLQRGELRIALGELRQGDRAAGARRRGCGPGPARPCLSLP